MSAKDYSVWWPVGRALGTLVVFSIAGAIAAEAKREEHPVKISIDRIAGDFRQAVRTADERYRKQLQPIARRRALAVEQAGKSATLRLEKVAREAKEAGFELGAGLVKTEIEKVKKTVEDAKASQPKVAWTVEHQGHRYLVILAPVTWAEARKACEDMGGHLAFIETKEEMKFLQTLIRRVGCWVGCTDEHRERDWRWLNRARVDRSLWAHGQPDNAGGRQDFCILNEYGLDDIQERKGSGFICEWE